MRTVMSSSIAGECRLRSFTTIHCQRRGQLFGRITSDQLLWWTCWNNGVLTAELGEKSTCARSHHTQGRGKHNIQIRSYPTKHCVPSVVFRKTLMEYTLVDGPGSAPELTYGIDKCRFTIITIQCSTSHAFNWMRWKSDMRRRLLGLCGLRKSPNCKAVTSM